MSNKQSVVKLSDLMKRFNEGLNAAQRISEHAHRSAPETVYEKLFTSFLFQLFDAKEVVYDEVGAMNIIKCYEEDKKEMREYIGKCYEEERKKIDEATGQARAASESPKSNWKERLLDIGVWGTKEKQVPPRPSQELLNYITAYEQGLDVTELEEKLVQGVDVGELRSRVSRRAMNLSGLTMNAMDAIENMYDSLAEEAGIVDSRELAEKLRYKFHTSSK